MRKQKIYVSGAIAHHDIGERRMAFESCASFCELCGFEAVNPFENKFWKQGRGMSADWREHMKEDLRMLLECDAICMMDGWEGSKGCKLELDVASSCGLTVYYETSVRAMRI